MSKQYAVIGLGRFGGRVVEMLAKAGHYVLAIDKSPEKIAYYSDIATHAVEADTTNESVLKDLGIHNMQTVVVGIGDDIQANIMTSMILKELGVAYIISKARNSIHGNILKKIGINKIVFPERDSGTRVAHNLISHRVLDYVDLSDSLGIIEMVAPPPFINKTLNQIDCRKHFNATIISIKRNKNLLNIPDEDVMILDGDVLIITGSNKALNKIEGIK
jgi:trk system potassium uptake protein